MRSQRMGRFITCVVLALVFALGVGFEIDRCLNKGVAWRMHQIVRVHAINSHLTIGIN